MMDIWVVKIDDKIVYSIWCYYCLPGTCLLYSSGNLGMCNRLLNSDLSRE